MKLSNLRRRGRYINPETGRPVNVHVGRNVQRGTDIHFFLRSGKRVLISDRDLFTTWEKVNEPF